MGLFSNLFSNKSMGFGEEYISQIKHMNGQRTVVSIQLDSNSSFPRSLNRSKDNRVIINGEIRKERLFFGILNASDNQIKLTNKVNQFEEVKDFDNSFEIALTIEKVNGGWSQILSYKDLKSAESIKMAIKGHLVYTI
jgi:hypothetical protein